MLNITQLCASIQKNCHLSDKNHAQNYGLCTYLLKMREMYRWEKDIPLTTSLDNKSVGAWLSEREALWDDLGEPDYQCLPLENQCLDPFDSTTINRKLVPAGLVYSGGYGQFCKPSFFIGRLLQHEQQEDLDIFITDDEFARDLNAPPAMSQGQTIYIRRDALRRALWQRLEDWQWKQPDNPVLAQIIEHYQAKQNMEAALEQMADDEITSMILHETGEVQAGKHLGGDWEKLLIEVAGKKAEYLARAVRDHLADCSVTLPQLIEQQNTRTLLMYIANFKGMRKALFPQLFEALRQWQTQPQQWHLLQTVVEQGQEHWLRVAQDWLTLYQHQEWVAEQIAEQQESVKL